MNILVLRLKNKADNCERLGPYPRFVKIPWWILMKTFSFQNADRVKKESKGKGRSIIFMQFFFSL